MTLSTIITSIENFIDPKDLAEGEDEVATLDLSDGSDDGGWDEEDDGLSAQIHDDDQQASESTEFKDFEKDIRYVHRMFKALQAGFEERFKRMWA